MSLSERSRRLILVVDDESSIRCRSLLRQKDLVEALESAESVVFALVRAIEAISPFTHTRVEWPTTL